MRDDVVAFTHYFGGEKADVQLEHFHRMMSYIGQAGSPYDIQFECSDTPDCGPKTAMVTGAGVAPGRKKIQVCDRFWTSASTKYFLHDYDRDSLSPPFRSNAPDQWCAKKKNGEAKKGPNFFATSGHTVLHELTHLDSLAKQAGLDPDAKNRHGTLDAQDEQKGCEMLGARAFLAAYKQDKTDDSPDYNAESYAAAATEYFFMNLCEFTEIP